MRNLLALWVLLCAPAALFVMGWGLMLIYREAGMAAFLVSCVVMFTAALGIASLLDKNQQP